jgi:hypothetical protein
MVSGEIFFLKIIRSKYMLISSGLCKGQNTALAKYFRTEVKRNEPTLPQPI